MISITIAVPVAYYVMNKWLQGFAYRHDLTITVFLYSAVIASGIGALTVGVQSIRAAIANPINSLRNE
jgi:putative ABC transport system permease protein